MGYDADVERCAPLCIIDIRGAAETVAELLATMRLAPPNGANVWAGSDETSVARVGPRRWMIIAPMDDETELVGNLSDSGLDASVVPVSDAFAAFSISGPQAADVIAQASPLDIHPERFPENGASFTAFFGQAALLIRRAASLQCFVDASYEDYFADCFMRCHARLGPRFTQYRAGYA
jgi:sarcosine oxidase subunit gamma